MSAPRTEGAAAPRAGGKTCPAKRTRTPKDPSAPKRPCSERKLAANRANAKKSTGPRTPEGKARSRFNGVVHGLSASLAVLPGESPELLRLFTESIYADLRPRGAAEAVLVDQYVSIAWKLRRLGTVESRLAGYHLGVATSEYIEHRDTQAWAVKNGMQEAADHMGQPLDIDPQPASEWLLGEFLEGEGIMLRLMDLEMRLRATLQSTLKQLEDLRALRRQQEQDEAEGEDGEWEVEEWDEDEERWGAFDEEGDYKADDSTGVPTAAPPAQTEPTAGSDGATADTGAQVETGAPDASREGEGNAAVDAGIVAPGEATKATRSDASEGGGAGGTGGPSVRPLRAEGDVPR